jgi:nucleotide-binding universal stress UspA family protein
MMFSKILVPVDGSETANLALAKAGQLAKTFGSQVVLLTVIEPFPALTMSEMDLGIAQQQYAQIAAQQADGSLRKAHAVLQGLGVEAQEMKLDGVSAWRGIVDAAENLGADLIVMGSHGRKGVQKLLLGSVTQKVVSHAARSVLVVHAEK